MARKARYLTRVEWDSGRTPTSATCLLPLSDAACAVVESLAGRVRVTQRHGIRHFFVGFVTGLPILVLCEAIYAVCLFPKGRVRIDGTDGADPEMFFCSVKDK